MAGTLTRVRRPRHRDRARPAGRALGYWLLRYRRTWRGTLATSLLSPVLYLAAMGFGLGSLVDAGPGAGRLGGVDYLAFVAPGLLAATAMQTAVVECTWPVLGGIRWDRSYLAQTATPLRPRDVMAGHLAFVALRLAGGLAVFLLVAAAFTALRSPWAVLAWPVAVLCGLAHAAPVAAFSIHRESEKAFAALNRFVVVPMFLFSGTFFPVEQLPSALTPVAYLTPLWHGVELCRDLALGRAEVLPALGHVAYLGLWIVGGLLLAARAYERRLRR